MSDQPKTTADHAQGILAGGADHVPDAGKMIQQSTETLGDALPREMARVRDEVMPPYMEIGPAGAMALAVMRNDLDAAARAMAAGDVPGMVRALHELRGWKL